MRTVWLNLSPTQPLLGMVEDGIQQRLEFHDLGDGAGWRDASGERLSDEVQHVIEIAHLCAATDIQEQSRGKMLFDLWWNSKRLNDVRLQHVSDFVKAQLADQEAAPFPEQVSRMSQTGRLQTA